MVQSDETSPLLTQPAPARATPADVAPLRFRDLPRAVNMAGRAFAKNDLTEYFTSVATAPWSRACAWLLRFIRFAGSVYQRRMLTIGRGTAAVVFGAPNNHKTHWLVRLLSSILDAFRPTALVKRRNEFSSVIKPMVQDAFGATVDEMYEIEGLATDPEAQGRGYAKLLVKTVTDMADREGRDTWVVTTDARSFYEAVGFSVERTGVVGADDPTWRNPPISVYIMRRAAKRPQGEPEGADAA
ncbi:hypothetical protein OH77DRAFT_686931 [Trametes cingulata]|nr:hypothetical protein OH77DRAFT_686931 [Trametes cingulata]